MLLCTRRRRTFSHALASLLLLLSPLALLVGFPIPTHAKTALPDTVQVAQHPDGVHLSWDASNRVSMQQSPFENWPLVNIGGSLLPAQLVALRVPNTTDEATVQTTITPSIEQLTYRPWSGTINSATLPVPQTVDGDVRPDLAPPTDQTLPKSPVIVLRDGHMRGERLLVVAVTPFFAQQGEVQVATHIEATIPGTVPDDMAPLQSSLQAESPAPPWGTLAASNDAAATASLKIHVDAAGIQRIPGSALAAAGMNLTQINPAYLHLWHQGEEIALEEWGTADGVLNTGDELRFFAPQPGDRWNMGDTYWLTSGTTPGVRMTTRAAASGASATTPATTAIEQGTWRNNTIYDSTLAGPDGDHWFAADMRTEPGGEAATFNVSLAPLLPPSAGTVVLTINGSAYVSTTHRLTVSLGASSSSDTVEWGGTGDWSHEFRMTTNGSAGDNALLLSLATSDKREGLEIGSIAWSWPVALDVGGKGAAFTRVPGVRHYQLANVAADSALYDVTDPQHPVRLTFAPGNPTLDVGDTATAHAYVVAGNGTQHTPTVTQHTPVDLLTPMNAGVVYIAPTELHAALAPLVALRQTQGFSVVVVDTQAIYDVWSYGQVSPRAIRDFLRFAATTWNPAPRAVTLVGDGTSDPLNYSGKDNTNLVPPYLAMVDPWIGETACDTCYVQLDGEDPLDDALPDLFLGRLPVKSSDELSALVNKIIAYETGGSGGSWRSRSGYLADNYREADGSYDKAGDFAAFADQSAALQPDGVIIDRLYYDPWTTHIGVSWREPDPARAYQRTLAMFNNGAGLINYVGHGHYYQMAVTNVSATPSYLLSLYDPDSLTNGTRLPVLLEMTCLTSGFHQPSQSGTTIDERMILHPGGGAIGVWGSTGYGVGYGHDSLQEGFYRELWESDQSLKPPLGALTNAGYRFLFTDGICCQESLRTFVLLGEPFTRPGVYAASFVYLPIIVR